MNHAMQACEMPETVFVYVAEEVDKRIEELEAIIRGRDELIENAVSSRIAELELSRKELIEEFAEAECMGDLAKIARNYGYQEQE